MGRIIAIGTLHFRFGVWVDFGGTGRHRFVSRLVWIVNYRSNQLRRGIPVKVFVVRAVGAWSFVFT